MADGRRTALDLALLAAALVVAALTLTPAGGADWAWGAPLTELRWYATGLDSPATRLQLLGNLLLLVPNLGQRLRREQLLRLVAPGRQALLVRRPAQVSSPGGDESRQER